MEVSKTKRNLIKQIFYSHPKKHLFRMVFLLILSITSVLLTLNHSEPIFATPQAPSSPITLSLSLSTNDLQMNMDNQFKTSSLTVNVKTNNPTGYTLSLSDTDEDTKLASIDSTNTAYFSSIVTNATSANFPESSWGYSLDNTTFRPVPKKSIPDTIKQTNTSTLTSGEDTDIVIGVKTGPSMPSDTYQGALEISVITNYVPETATFLRGQNFQPIYFDLVKDRSVSEMWFKKSLTPPANLATAKIVSTTDSEAPIYMWYDTTNNTVYWWSQATTVYANEKCANMFGEASQKYADMNLDLKGIDTSKTTDMNFMFGVSAGEEKNIKTIDLSEFNTESVENMSFMFYNMTNITSLNLTSFNTKNVTNMRNMFYQATNIASLDISTFNTQKVTEMSNMFYGLEKVTSLNFSSFNTENVKAMSNMFNGTKRLSSLDLTSFNTKNVTKMDQMFSDCGATTLLISNFNTSKVTTMKGMFQYMNKLTTLNVTGFDTRNVTNMENMFRRVSRLTSLDLSNFNTTRVTSTKSMFDGAGSLVTIKTSTLFDTTNVISSENMFMNNLALIGGNGTAYSNTNPNDKTYARIDAVGTPGYFTSP